MVDPNSDARADNHAGRKGNTNHQAGSKVRRRRLLPFWARYSLPILVALRPGKGSSWRSSPQCGALKMYLWGRRNGRGTRDLDLRLNRLAGFGVFVVFVGPHRRPHKLLRSVGG